MVDLLRAWIAADRSRKPGRQAVRNAILGILLALGAPAGTLLIRILLAGVAPGTDLREHAFFYAYSLIGTILAFGSFGFYLGARADRLRESRDEYEDLALHDELTSLSNARAFQRHYGRAIERARDSGEPLALLLFDVDGLKEINDRCGHSVGSAALVRVARAIDRCRRAGDLACRWGGDEFALVMPGADVRSARRVAERVHRELAEKRDGPNDDAFPRISVSIGIAVSPPLESDLFERADRALYVAKQFEAGRPRIAEAPPKPAGRRD